MNFAYLEFSLAISQGFQLSRIERESPSWTLFLPLSRQACKISHINEKKSRHACKISRISGETLEKNYLTNFHRQGGMQPKKTHTYQLRFKTEREIKHFVAHQMQNFLRQGGVQT